MLIQKETNPNILSIKNYQPGLINVSGREFNTTIVLTENRVSELEPFVQFQELSSELLSTLVEDETELLLVGSGEHHKFIPPETTFSLLKSGVAVESMSTRNACHTYQVLAHEGRKVVALLYP